MIKKVCFVCKEEKDLSEFYVHKQMKDGHLNRCKECVKAYSRSEEYRQMARPRDRKRYLLNLSRNKAQKEQSKKYYENNPEKVKAFRKKYYLNHVELIMARQKETRIKKPLPYKANMAVSNNKRNGKIIKMPCIICNNFKSEAHHEDYMKPLEVIWLCSLHHKWLHIGKLCLID